MRITPERRADLHGKLEFILNANVPGSKYHVSEVEERIDDGYHYSRMESLGRQNRKIAKTATDEYRTHEGVLLTVTDIEKAGPIPIQALHRQSGILQWIDHEAGRIVSTIRYRIEPENTDRGMRSRGFFLGFAALTVRFADGEDDEDAPLWEQTVEMRRNEGDHASLDSWAFRCPFQRDYDHLTTTLFLGPQSWNGVFICPDCLDYEKPYRECVDRRKRETLCLIPEGGAR